MSVRRQRQPHYIAGMGDGNVRDSDSKFLHDRPHPIIPKAGNIRKRPNNNINIAREITAQSYARQHHQQQDFISDSGDATAGSTPIHIGGEGGPWQVSAMALLGMLGLLLALFLHLITESNPNQSSYSYKQQKARKITYPTSKKKKKEKDEQVWSEDDEVSSSYPESTSVTTTTMPTIQSSSTAAASATGVTNQDTSYYLNPYQPRYHQQQQHRHRKISAGGYKEVFPSSPKHNRTTVINSRPYYHHTTSGRSSAPTSQPKSPYAAPSSHHRRNAGRQAAEAGTTATTATPSGTTTTTFGASGLEGFVSSTATTSTQAVAATPTKIAPKPLSPVSSFASFNNASSDKESASFNEEDYPSQTLPLSPPNIIPEGKRILLPLGGGVSSVLGTGTTTAAMIGNVATATAISTTEGGDISDNSTSSLDIIAGSEDFQSFVTPKAGSKEPIRLNLSSQQQLQVPHNDGTTHKLPFMPNLQVVDPSRPITTTNDNDFEELSIVNMESGAAAGVVTTADGSNIATPASWLNVEEEISKEKNNNNNNNHAQKAYPGHPSPLRASQNNNNYGNAGVTPPVELPQATPSPKKQIQQQQQQQHQQQSSNNARNSIIHKRTDLTHSTDATASLLSSSIQFKELSLESVIGGGGFGQVWKATWRGTPVAVKVLTGSAQAAMESKIIEEFAAEINMLKGMRHPNICLYMGACLDPPNRAIVTELASNGSLWDALRLPLKPPYQACSGMAGDQSWPQELFRNCYNPGIPPAGTWPWALVKRVACGAARGMTYLHSGNPPVLHRDLKSANLLLDDSYTAKVCDFGLSRLKEQERSMTGNCGTVQWMAPEVLANQRYAEPADVFSFGIILWECLSRECPYEGMSAIQCALAVLNRNYRPAIPTWCPPALAALIESCVERDPAKRPTFAQIILALDAMP